MMNNQYPWHEAEDLLLNRIQLLRIEFELEMHRDAHQDRQDANGQEAGRIEGDQTEQIHRRERIRCADRSSIHKA